MRISASQYAKTLIELSKGDPMNPDVLAGGFLSVLRRKRDLRKWPTILRMFGKMADEQAGRLSLLAETAHTLDAESRRGLETLVGEAFPGKELVIRYEVRSDLLGGARISADDEMLDATVLARLRALEKVLR